MKHFAVAFFFSILFIFSANAQEPLSYFLPEDVTFNSNIPTPEEYFNQQLGEWHLTHDQVLSYMKEIARISERAVIREYARSYENRPLVHLIFTSEQNQNKLDELKELHFNYSQPGENMSPENIPLVVNLGYGVHGNESSATNSSVLTAYYLAAAQGDKIDQLLESTIILVDPCLNPDGFVRHSTWANMHQSITDVTSPDSRQFREVWPGGRTNHYWFDLNRDWLLLVHPESRGRVAAFHEWKPNIVTDHHEMGANSTFFFQPGVPSRNNPLTPEENYRLTYEIAKYHAEFLDEIGSPYYMEEQFDDYYFGKGSSYPDVNSSVGILFEQAGYRGRIRETSNGIKTLAFGIKNQFTVSLSTLEAAINLKDELLQFQKEFYREALELADKDAVKAYVFGDENNLQTTLKFVNVLNQHQIQVFPNEQEYTSDGKTFKPGSSFVVPLKQPQYRLIKSMFDVTTEFADSTFYDVSTWTFPYAFNLPFAKLTSLRNIQISEKMAEPEIPEGKVVGGKSSLAYLFKWNEYAAPEALFQIQNKGLMTKVATDEFTFIIDGNEESFTYGTILVPAAGQEMDEEEIFSMVTSVAQKTGIDFYGLDTGLASKGIHIGSGSFVSLEKPEVLMLIGGSVSSRDAGEIWHLFDQQYKIPVTLADSDNLGSINLNRYNNLILPAGSYRELNNTVTEKIRRWTEAGGTLITIKNAASWATRNDLGKTQFKKSIEPDTTLQLNYVDRSKEYSINAIAGAIFKTEMDITHPLCYGYLQEELPVFKSGNSVAESLKTKYAEPVKFSDDSFLSGFVSEKNLERIKNAPVVSVQSAGGGKVISYHESMTFRGTWLGTNKLFMNSVFFGKTIR
ncbi:M14 family zinc carboxypeptidase [Mariniphaga sp.]|uniref:M14 family zinc carboxypeptidase n=1 Tax=Mariniphaga sp. TaxID=1954475 RepID=UPI003564B327